MELKDDLNPKDVEFLDNALIDLKIKLNEKSTVNEISGMIHGQMQPILKNIQSRIEIDLLGRLTSLHFGTVLNANVYEYDFFITSLDSLEKLVLLLSRR